MVQPIDYLSQLQMPDIGANFIGGLATGQAVKQQQQQKAQAEQYSADLQAYLAAPNAQAAAAMTAKYPAQREAFKQAWDIQSKDQQDANFRAGTQVYSAIQNGRPDVAAQVLDENITAMENAGQDATPLKTIRETLQRDPKTTGAQIGLTLAALEPDRWSKVATEMREAEQAPAELSEKQAKAQKAAVDAKFAESMAVQDLAKAGWDIAKIQNDIGISRQNSQIAAMNAGLKRETNDLKRMELQQKVQEAQLKRDTGVREKAAQVESERSQIDNLLSTADKFLKTPVGVISSAAGPISSQLPTVDSDTADLEELVDVLGNQVTMSRIGEMKGVLSDSDLKVLRSSLQGLSLRQSPERLIENVKEAQRLMLKARSGLSEKYGVPDVIPDRPALESQPASSGFKVLGVE